MVQDFFLFLGQFKFSFFFFLNGFRFFFFFVGCSVLLLQASESSFFVGQFWIYFVVLVSFSSDAS
ncbi:hypothetical protein C1646_418919 [Rhizophagus diaphanus]|nr:hypothetical protein C1646_418919 [Rhizophagus diaphanus] [Rhizophagus sp. MUCL 43196]